MSNKGPEAALNAQEGVRVALSPYLTWFEPFRMKKKIKIVAQENNMVSLFREMTNSSALSE